MRRHKIWQNRMALVSFIILSSLFLVPVTTATSESQHDSTITNKEQSGRFKPTDTEKLFLENISKGGWGIRYISNEPEEVDPNRAENWDPERVIRGVVLSGLCMQSQRHRVKDKGIRLYGARIDGKVDLCFAEIPFPLYFEKCAFTDVIDLRHAKIRNLYLLGTHTSRIDGDGLTVEGDIHMMSGFKSNGVVRLPGATIGGQLACSGGMFINKEGEALILEGALIQGSVHLDKGFYSHGEVCLGGARIDGSLECIDGKFNKNEKGEKAISAYNLLVEGNVYMRDKFISVGEVSLYGATINGQLDCEDCTFMHKGGTAILAENMVVRKDVNFCNRFKAAGKISLMGAKIDGNLRWLDIASPEQVILDLRYARIGMLYDERKSWPGKGKLILQGLVYKDFAFDAPIDLKSRVEWLTRQPSHRYSPQPYEQLAAWLRDSGYDDEAKQILIEKNKDKRRRTKLTWTSFWNFEWLWYKFIGRFIMGYGYRPGYAFWWGLGFVVSGWVIFGKYKRLFIRAKGEQYVSAVCFKDQLHTEYYPHFSSFVYSLDAFLPIINLHQINYWLPVRRWLYVVVWFLNVSGWIITTLLILGLTGLIRT